MKKIYFILAVATFMASCSKPNNNLVTQGKIERDQIAVVGKLPGRILKIYVSEGDFVKKGDTLAFLDAPEVDAKKNQAKGALTAANAQYQMATKGATDNQLKQLRAKQKAMQEQFNFAQKSIKRLDGMIKDSLVSQQTYDEAFTKYQGAQSQLLAVEAEIADVQHGVRIEQQTMALGQQERALGALQEVQSAENDRYILAPQDMSIENISLKVGELALPGYALFSGYLVDSVYFRFTLPESKLNQLKKGQELPVTVAYNNSQVQGKVVNIKQLGAYANIATAYPDYEMQETLFEIKIVPLAPEQSKDLLTKATVTLSL
ncbi:HlyD family secretion protein [Flavobacterium sp. JP2137]|uniref:HlyD family secretion protein n=1 Tax=Flavobacterium sp. JP2137 TaxID=3414510 RepID=UPI003D2FF5EF